MKSFAIHQSQAAQGISRYVELLDGYLHNMLITGFVKRRSEFAIQKKAEIEFYRGVAQAMMRNVDKARNVLDGFEDNPSMTYIKDVIIGEGLLGFVNRTAIIEFYNGTDTDAKEFNETDFDISDIINFNITDEQLANITINATKGNQTGRRLAVNITSFRSRPAMPDIDASIMQAIDESYLEGLFVVEIEVRALEQAEEDWTGNIVAVVFGAVQIAIGVMLLGPAIGPALAALNAGTSVAAAVSAAGVGVFTTGFATGFIAGGIGDVIGSVSSFMKDAPMDVNGYFKSKAMGLAINIITSGTLHALQGFEVLRIGTAHESFWAGMGKAGMSHYMTKQVLFQAAMYGLNQVTQKQAKDYMDHNAGNIKQDATAAASSIVDDNYDPYLRRILAYDASHGTNAQASGIVNDAVEVTNGYSSRFQGTGEQIARGAASGIAGGLLGGFGMAGQVASVVTNAATNIGFGLVKSAEASGEYRAKMLERIINRYNSLPGTKSQMLSYLEADPILRPDAIAIMNELISLGFATAEEIDYRNCGKLTTINLGSFNSTRATLLADCNIISGYMDITNNHATTRVALRKSLAEIFTSQLTGIFAGEVVMPAMSLPNGFIAGFAAEKLAEAFKKEAKREEAKPVTILGKAGKGKSSKPEAIETSEDQEPRSHIRLRKPVDEKTMKQVVDRMLKESEQQPYASRENFLEEAIMANIAYNGGEAVDIQRMLNEAGVKNVKVLDVFSDWGGARANLIEKTYEDGSRRFFYTIAGTARATLMDPKTWVGSIQDILNDASIAFGGNKITGNGINAFASGLRMIGEDQESFSADNKPFAMTNEKGWDQIPDRVDWYIKHVEDFNKNTGNKVTVIGHSAGGYEAVGMLAKRPDLVVGATSIDTPGVKRLVETIQPNADKQQEVYNNIRIYNADPNFINKASKHADSVNIFHIESKSHSLETIIESYKQNGATKVNAKFYN